MEVAQPYAIPSQLVDHRRVDGRAVAAQLAETHVVEHNQHDIGRTGWRRRLRWPPGLRLPPVPPDSASELCTHELVLLVSA